MRRFVFICAALILIEGAGAQPYVPPPNVGAYPTITPGTTAPAPPTGYAAPGYNWREDRGDADWRNNTWREDRFEENWRNRNWQTRRELQDWRERQDYSKARNPDNPFDQGYVECGKGSVGSSTPCVGYKKTSPTKKIEGSGTSEQTGENEKKSASPRGVENCGHGGVWRRC